jgi:two-component system chemotaxis response regulator CheB
MTQLKKTVRVMLIDDSPVVLHILKKLLVNSPAIEVVGVFTDGFEALASISTLKPDVVCTDFHMPKINGLELIMQIMETDPKPILVISSAVQAEGDENTIFALLEAGAVDVFPKPLVQTEEEFRKTGDRLIKKIILLSGVYTFRRKRKDRPAGDTFEQVQQKEFNPGKSFKIIGVGASTGGPQVLTELFDFFSIPQQLPVVCVQHISEGFIAGFVEWFDRTTSLKVGFATEGALPEPGNIYFPPEDTHLKFDKSGRFRFSKSPNINGHRPSVDETFNSLAESYGSGTLAILLTGMGSDGAQGLLNIKKAGGFTVTQSEKSCVVYGMPKIADDLGASDLSLSPLEIKRLLNNLKKS